MSPLVSILIPCYNAERWVACAIESALAQTWPEKEVIVVDDGSTDGSLEVIKRFSHRIRWETGPNRGAPVARNRLLELARAEWIQYLDADDYLLPTKIAHQMEYVIANLGTDLVYGPITSESVSEQGTWQKTHPIPQPHDPWRLLALQQLPPTIAPLWRRLAIVDVGGWKPDQPCAQENELYSRLLIGGKRFDYCPHNGAVHRNWGGPTITARAGPEAHRRTLEISRRVEDHLRERGELTSERLWAIHQGRFKLAREAWQGGYREAMGIMQTIWKTDPRFVPAREFFPRGYRCVYKFLGFRWTENVASWNRRLLRWVFPTRVPCREGQS